MSLFRPHALAAVALAALPALATPSAARAQDGAATPSSESRTHRVRRGDTLWDLSRAYLGDPFLWPQIYRLNTAVVEDPHWIYPGERLTVPGSEPLVAEAPQPEPSASTTVFVRDDLPGRRGTGAEHLAPLGRGQFSAVRPGEVYAAPFVDRDGGPARAGSIVKTVAVSSIRANLGDGALLLNDEVYITAPGGVTAAVGDQFLVYALGARIEKVGQLVSPTGVLRVERVAEGETPRARLTQQYGRVLVGQQLLALNSEVPGAGDVPEPVQNGATATVIWVPNEAVLPSLQQYLVLDASARKGTRVGDQFTLVRSRETRPGLLAIPEEEIAVAQVVRVTPYAATALIVSQDHPAVGRGTRARVSGKMR